MTGRIVAGTVVLGCAVGLAVAAAQPSRYRGHAAIVVAPALHRTDPALGTFTRTAVSLVRSDAVAVNVIQALHLNDSAARLRSEIHASARTGTAIVDISVDRSSRVDAERVAQQVLVVFERLADARFGGGSVEVWDAPAQSATSVGKPWGAWGTGGASLGLLVGAAAIVLRGRRRATTAAEPTARASEPVPAAAPPPSPPPAQENAPQPAPEERGLLAELRRRVESEPDAARRAEMLVYLEQVAPFAGPAGDLPDNLLGIVEEVFGPVSRIAPPIRGVMDV